MSEGYIVFQVTTSRGLIPIKGAYASVMKGEGDRRELLGFRITDEDGKTSPITIETPPKSLSTSPNDNQVFTACNIRVDHPDYYTVQVRDVQVFEGITSLQQIQMIPLQENAPVDSRQDTFEVVPQNL